MKIMPNLSLNGASKQEVLKFAELCPGANENSVNIAGNRFDLCKTPEEREALLAEFKQKAGVEEKVRVVEPAPAPAPAPTQEAAQPESPEKKRAKDRASNKAAKGGSTKD